MPDAMPANPPSTAEFRKLMGQFATGVCVVSLHTSQNSIAAMTINSFVSVSLEPMLVCWSLHNSSSQFDLFAKAEKFAVSILAEDQGDLALRYAARGDTMLNEGDFAVSAGGLPYIARSVGHFECKHWSSNPAGDHTMLLGEVIGMSAPPGEAHNVDASPSPLGFFNGQFCSIGKS